MPASPQKTMVPSLTLPAAILDILKDPKLLKDTARHKVFRETITDLPLFRTMVEENPKHRESLENLAQNLAENLKTGNIITQQSVSSLRQSTLREVRGNEGIVSPHETAAFLTADLMESASRPELAPFLLTGRTPEGQQTPSAHLMSQHAGATPQLVKDKDGDLYPGLTPEHELLLAEGHSLVAPEHTLDENALAELDAALAAQEPVLERVHISDAEPDKKQPEGRTPNATITLQMDL